MSQLFSVNIIIEFAGFILALFCLFREHNKIWRIQIIYLLLSVIAEIMGRYMIKIMHSGNNSRIYNVLLIAEAFFVTGMFYTILQQFKRGKPIVYCGFILFIASYLFGLFRNGFSQYNSDCDTMMSVFYCCCCFYFYYLLLKDDDYQNLSRLAPFWWINGTLFFYFGNMACDLFFDNLAKVPNLYLRYYIIEILNIIQYTCLSYAFICKYQQRKLVH